MKRFNYIFIILFVSFVSSCVGIEEVSSPIDDVVQLRSSNLSAILEAGPDSRTTLKMQDDGAFKCYWSKGDSLGVVVDNNASTIYPYELSEGMDSSTATFSGTGEGNHYDAFYPFTMITGYSDGKFNVELPSEYDYVDNSISANSFPMIAESDNTTLKFKNLGSVLRISAKGKYKIRSFLVEANDPSIMLNGSAVVEDQTLVMLDGGTNKLRINNVNVNLDPDEETDFYIVLPPQEYIGGLTVTFYTSSGYIRKVASSNIVMERSQIRTARMNLTELTEGVEPVTELKGLGTEESPYLIGSLADLLYVESMRYYSSSHFKLIADISLKYACGRDTDNWLPIGGSSKFFSGTFDGDGHVISDLYIHSSRVLRNQGLFGIISGTVKNLTVIGDVDCPNSSLIGVLCGYHHGRIINCISKGAIVGKNAVGGLCGSYSGLNNENSIIECCENYASVKADSNFGGIAGGCTRAYVNNCINYGSIWNNGSMSLDFGGIVGSSHNSRISNCANFGTVDGMDGSGGGIAGVLYQDDSVINCYNLGSIYNSVYISGGIVGYNVDGLVVNCYNAGNVEAETYAGGNVGINKGGNVSHCYWLLDANKGLGNIKSIGSGAGESSQCSSMTKASMQSNYLLDKLNEWVDANGDQNSRWKFVGKDTYPVLEFEETAHETHESHFNGIIFEGSNSAYLEPSKGTFNVSMVSYYDINVSDLPLWIHQEGEVEVKEDGLKVFHFSYESNPHVSSRRVGELSFNNTEGYSVKYSVTQFEVGYYISTDFSQDGIVSVIQKATKGKGIDVVIMGDAFTDKDITDGTYHKSMQKAIEAFFSKEPYKTYRDLFNVYEVNAVSRDGNYFDIGGMTAFSGYYSGGTHVGGNNSAAYNYALKALSQERMNESLIIVVMNMKRYAGTCNMYIDDNIKGTSFGSGFAIAYCPICEDDSTFAEVVNHEAGGHGFAKLADEYVNYPDRILLSRMRDHQKMYNSYGWYKNVDFTSDATEVKWAKFLEGHNFDNENLGVYEGAATYAYGVYRPSENSIMRYNQGQYNAPSREAIWYRIHKLAYGDEWEYSFDEFLRYDVYNRNLIYDVPMTKAQKDAFVPLGAPVVHDHTDFVRLIDDKQLEVR